LHVDSRCDNFFIYFRENHLFQENDMPLPTNPPKVPNDAPKDVLRYTNDLNKFLTDLLANLPKPTPIPTPGPAIPVIRAGIGRIEHDALQSSVSIGQPIKGDYAVVVTEWRNEPSNSINLFRLYVMQTAPDHFILGHDKYTGQGDAPSYAWIAIAKS
jgi:hypothetical protein